MLGGALLFFAGGFCHGGTLAGIFLRSHRRDLLCIGGLLLGALLGSVA